MPRILLLILFINNNTARNTGDNLFVFIEKKNCNQSLCILNHLNHLTNRFELIQFLNHVLFLKNLFYIKLKIYIFFIKKEKYLRWRRQGSHLFFEYWQESVYWSYTFYPVNQWRYQSILKKAVLPTPNLFCNSFKFNYVIKLDLRKF